MTVRRRFAKGGNWGGMTKQWVTTQRGRRALGTVCGLFLLMLALLVPAVGLDLRIGPRAVSPEAVAFPLVLDVVPQEPVASLQAGIRFTPDAFEFYEAYPGEAAAAAGKDVAAAQVGESELRVIVAGFNQTVMGSGVVAEIYFLPRGAGTGASPQLVEAVFSGPEGDRVVPYTPPDPDPDPDDDPDPVEPDGETPAEGEIRDGTTEGESGVPTPGGDGGTTGDGDGDGGDGKEQEADGDGGGSGTTTGQTLYGGGGIPGGVGGAGGLAESDVSSRDSASRPGSTGRGRAVGGPLNNQPYSVNWSSGGTPSAGSVATPRPVSTAGTPRPSSQGHPENARPTARREVNTPTGGAVATRAAEGVSEGARADDEQSRLSLLHPTPPGATQSRPAQRDGAMTEAVPVDGQGRLLAFLFFGLLATVAALLTLRAAILRGGRR